MNVTATRAIILTLMGCTFNVVSLEYIIQLDPGAGNLITFCQFVFIALHGFIFTSKFGTVKPKIALKDYMILVFLLFITSVVNNGAYAYNISVPLFIIFRAGSLIANMILGVTILKRSFTVEKYVSVFLITIGIIICTLYSSNPKRTTCFDCDVDAAKIPGEVSTNRIFWWVIGVILITASLLLSAGMGIFQEQLYKKHGKHPQEALYYTHLYSIPGFLMYSSNLLKHAANANNSETFNIPLLNMAVPILWIFLILNVVTQFLCIKNVYVLTTECESLTVTLVITLRKVFSLLFSIIYFKNPVTAAHWVGIIMVFSGTLIFSEMHLIIEKCYDSSNDKTLKKS